MPAALLALAIGGVTAACGGSGPAPDTAIGSAAAPGAGIAPASPDTSPGPALPTTGTNPGAVSPRTTPGAAGAAADPRPVIVAPDTVRGVVSEVGSQPMTSVVVQPAAGGAVTIRGSLAREIARAAGAEVWVAGTRDARVLEAAAYAVRRVDGEAAVDGVLARDGDRLVLVTPAGRHPIARPLQAFRGMIGARVWLVGPLDGTITSYGVLREP